MSEKEEREERRTCCGCGGPNPPDGREVRIALGDVSASACSLQCAMRFVESWESQRS